MRLLCQEILASNWQRRVRVAKRQQSDVDGKHEQTKDEHIHVRVIKRLRFQSIAFLFQPFPYDTNMVVNRKQPSIPVAPAVSRSSSTQPVPTKKATRNTIKPAQPQNGHGIDVGGLSSGFSTYSSNLTLSSVS